MTDGFTANLIIMNRCFDYEDINSFAINLKCLTLHILTASNLGTLGRQEMTENYSFLGIVNY
jgi:hypothetical protein